MGEAKGHQAKQEMGMGILARSGDEKVPVFLKDNLLKISPDLPLRREVPAIGASLYKEGTSKIPREWGL